MLLLFILLYIFDVIILSFGVLSNLANATVFLLLGLRDSFGITFFVLTLADLAYAVLFLTHILLRLVAHVGLSSSAPLVPVAYLMSQYASTLFDISVVLTVLLAVQKCCCVSMPLKFKNVFTTSRTLFMISCISVLIVATNLPILSTQGLVTKNDYITNSSSEALWFSKDRPVVTAIHEVGNRIVLPIASVCVVCSCLFVLIPNLKRSMNFRSSFKLTSDPRVLRIENQVTKAVMSVSAIFVLCNLPIVARATASLVEREFNDMRRHGYMFVAVENIRQTCLNLNCALNIFAYLAFNSNYRARFMSLFCDRKG
ncbi:unnamed protein product [Lymnaea stagnalis]|uniref:G-protein coupled receptors family 1 profile domain-containing protein n=1 Tax=Lymnaea stagnalis TaxID=6523 RepID=A0AAV2IBU6_LYMST